MRSRVRGVPGRSAALLGAPNPPIDRRLGRVSLLVIMGSGETAPAMVATHRAVFAATGEGPAALLDTPFGFQGNADDLTSRTLAYFAESVGRSVVAARWRRADEAVLERESALALLAHARWVFAGPGSPSYALRHWVGTPVPGALVDVVERGGTLVMGSAAAVTLGTHAIPVYEIYKVGEDPHWLPGLDLFGRLTGIPAAVVPHYDNAEGGTHDTRFFYLGEHRLAQMEQSLPDEVGVLGVDEHTALTIDLSARTARVDGNGVVTIRRRDGSRTLPSGESLALDHLAGLLRGGPVDPTDPVVEVADAAPVLAVADQPSLRAETDRARTAFEAALAARDVEGCVAAVLSLEQALHDWRADTLQGEDNDRARRALRSMVVRLGTLATVGARDPRSVVGPYVELLLELRGRARAAKDFATSDLVRDRLAAAGVEVRDTPDGTQWQVSG